MALKRTIEKTSCHQKKHIIEHLLHNLVNGEMKSTRRDIFQLKNTKIANSSSILFWSLITSVSVTLQYEKKSTPNQLQILKKLDTMKTQLDSSNQGIKTKALAKIFSICLNNIWTPGTRTVYI